MGDLLLLIYLSPFLYELYPELRKKRRAPVTKFNMCNMNGTEIWNIFSVQTFTFLTAQSIVTISNF